MASEEQLIERVRRHFVRKASGVRVGIGDDAAVLRVPRGSELVVTTDAFLENVHFLRKIHPPDALGYKALARATSDIAAMGAYARCFFLTLALPSGLASSKSSWLDHFLGGMARAARKFNLILAGGDTTNYSCVNLSLTVIGEARAGRAILRSGARPGDLLCVSGTLGEAELGLRLVLENMHRERRWAALLPKHYYPQPRLALGQWLADRQFATAMIDTSDGLSTDLAHICKSSGVGAVVDASSIPAVKVPARLHKRDKRGFDPLTLAVHGGEDYELLFTVPKRLAAKLPRSVDGVPLAIIGEITASKEVVLVMPDGKRAALTPGGWDPFRRKQGLRAEQVAL